MEQEFFDDVWTHPCRRTVACRVPEPVAHLTAEQLKQVGRLDFKVLLFDGPQQSRRC